MRPVHHKLGGSLPRLLQGTPGALRVVYGMLSGFAFLVVKSKLVRAEYEFGAGGLFFGGVTHKSDIYLLDVLVFTQKHIELKAR